MAVKRGLASKQAVVSCLQAQCIDDPAPPAHHSHPSSVIHVRLCSYVTLRILGMDAEDKVCRDARAWVRSSRTREAQLCQLHRKTKHGGRCLWTICIAFDVTLRMYFVLCMFVPTFTEEDI